MVMGGTASQDGNLAQLSKVSKEKPPKKETSPGPETFSKLLVMGVLKHNLCHHDCPMPNHFFQETQSYFLLEKIFF